VAAQSILALYAFGILEPNMNTGQEKIDLRGNIWWLEDKMYSMNLWLHEIESSCHHYIKLVLMKQFVKVLNKDGSCIEYIAHKLPGLTMEKLKAGIFDDPQIRKLINDTHFIASMN
jgi:hypothetical protein